MSNSVAVLPGAGQSLSEIMERVLVVGDLSQLTPAERTEYYLKVCQSTGLNPYTRPFEYTKLSGKTVLYARKDAADQLRRLHDVSLEITDRKITGDLMTVTVRATMPGGRHDEDIGALSVKGLQGEALANAILKCTTKAKRRATLSLCGLGVLDESEVESVQGMEQIAPPRQASAPAIEHQPAAPPAISKSRITVRHDGRAVEFARSREGIAQALDHIAAGGAGLAMENHELLSNIGKMDVFAERVALIRQASMAELESGGEGEGWPGQASGAEPPEPDQDSAGARMAAHRGDRPADVPEQEISGLPA